MSPCRGRPNRIRDALVALVVLGGLAGLSRVGVWPLSLPGHALLAGFDAVQHPLAPGLGGGARRVALGAYLLGLAGLGATIAGRLRRRFASGGHLRYGVAGAVLAPLVFGAAYLLARIVLALPADWTPLATGGLVGLVGLWAGWRLGGSRSRPGPE